MAGSGGGGVWGWSDSLPPSLPRPQVEELKQKLAQQEKAVQVQQQKAQVSSGDGYGGGTRQCRRSSGRMFWPLSSCSKTKEAEGPSLGHGAPFG